MKDIQITYTTPEIVVNGIRFEVLRSDAEIIDDVIAIDEAVNAEANAAKAVRLKSRMMLAYLDKLLGKDAAKRIADTIQDLPKGKAMGLAASVDMCQRLINDASKAYAEAFAIRYGDE